jgi:hypothetical protein
VEGFREIEFRGVKAIVVEDAKADFPKGYKVYGIRHADDDWDMPITVENFVCCNRWGRLGVREPMDLGIPDGGYLELNDDEIEEIRGRSCL